MKKFIIIGAAAAALALPVTASAAYGDQPGFERANSNTICAGHGAFGAFGNGETRHDFGVNNPGDDGKPGASKLTGPNNSALCGNG